MAFTGNFPLTNAPMLTSTSGISGQYQTKFNQDLLERVIQLTVLDQFSMKEPFPKNAGAKTMTFFRQDAGFASTTTGLGTGGDVVALTEGTIPTTSATISYTTVLATMAQYGSVYEFSDIYGLTALFNVLNGVKDRIAEVAALHADDIVRNVICGAGTTGATPAGAFVRLYANGQTSFANLGTNGGVLQVVDMLRAFTTLQINRAPKKNGKYYMIVPPQAAYDLMLDPKWLNIGFYQDKSQYVKGEVGQLYGVSIVVGTNPFLETSGGTEGTYSSTGTIFDSLAVGSNSFGTPILAGQSPYNPNIMIVNTADKLDVLNQITAVGWKAYWTAVTLNAKWGVNVKSKSSFA